MTELRSRDRTFRSDANLPFGCEAEPSPVFEMMDLRSNVLDLRATAGGLVVSVIFICVAHRLPQLMPKWRRRHLVQKKACRGRII